jgi:UDP-N-acetyl-2-amino-2-deoxyglucuronate dehydrogenase
VHWFLSINENDLPKKIKEKGQRIFRSITIDNQGLEFTDSHTGSYQEILKGNGFGLEDVKQTIQIVHEIRNNSIKKLGKKHPFIVN